MPNEWIDNCLFEENSGILLFTENTNMMRMTNSDVNKHEGIIAVITAHENLNYTSSFENVSISESVANDIDTSLIHLIGPVNEMFHPYVGFLSSQFIDNNGKLFSQTRTNDDIGMLDSNFYNLDCALSSDYGGMLFFVFFVFFVSCLVTEPYK